MLLNFNLIDNKQASAVGDYTNTTEIGKLTLDNYETNPYGKVFNGRKLSELYSALLGKSGATIADVKTTLASGNLDSQSFRTNNPDKKDVIVEIAGLKWAAVYLALNNTVDQEPVLTLWLAESEQLDSAYRSSVFNDYTSSYSTYTANMYATSKIRAVALNNGGKYATSATTLTTDPVDQDKDSPFAIYTMPNSTVAGKEVSGSIIDFIDTPENVYWQEVEQCRGASGTYNFENDAWSKTIANFSSTKSKYLNALSNYEDWKYDKLWLPSFTEVGWSNIYSGLWNRSFELYNNNADYWIRSASTASYSDCANQIGRGVTVTTKMELRPAFHLNLAKADSASLMLLDVPKNANMEYTSERIGVHSLSTLPSWYVSSVYDSSTLMTTQYKNSAGSAISGGLPRDEGEYTVEFTLTADGKKNYCWEDESTNASDTRSITFKITPKPIKYTLSGGGSTLPKVEHDVSDLGTSDTNLAQGKVLGFRYTGLYGSSYNDTKLPTVNGTYRATVIALNHNYTPDSNIIPDYKDFSVEGARANVPTFNDTTQGYDGGNAVSFVLSGFDSDQMEIVTPLPSGVSYDGVEIISATKAGKYKIKVALKHKDGSIYWNSLEGSEDMEDKELEFEITPAEISVMIDPDSGSTDTIKVVRNEKIKVSGMIMQQPLMSENGDTTNLHFWADLGSSKYELGYTDASGNKVMTGYPISANSGTVTLTDLELHTDVLPMNGKWTLRIESSNSDYEAELNSGIYLQVETKVVTADPTWVLKRNSARMDTQSVKLGDTTPIIYSKSLTYNDRYSYEFQMLAPGYKIDTAYDPSGYKVVANKGSSNTAIGKNADTYTTSVRLIDSSGKEVIYSITWTIDPVKFDLSGVKWLYNGQLPYDKINGSKAELDPKTLPAGLVPTVINNTGTTVGTSASASVSFTVDPAYVGNYIQPDETDPSTFIDPNSDFEWSKTWTIVPATIQASSWKNKTNQDTNGKAFDIPVLRDPNADGGIVEYEYYECDSTGNIINNTPITINDIVWSESDAKYYIAKPILQDTNNYTLDDPSAQSKVFRVGKDLTKVSVDLDKKVVEYNTNPRHATIKVTDSALPTTAFDLTYYDGYTRLTTAPTEVGKYRVEVSLKSSYIDKYQIDGDYEFDYEIVKAQIAIDWNDNIKPPTLKLSFGQINGVEYEIVDNDENVVSYNDLKAGETYKIRAKIKDNQLNHFVFVGDKTETDWHEFSVSNNDQLYDPNSPSNPSYPQTDPDLPGNSGDPSDPGTTPGGDDGDGPLDDILEKLKDIPLWQIIAGVI
ncbi:MAG: hypothetical protein K2J75_01540, partial [Clostridia bacterium]|nr:hypothetical protein [Clostridia bacterium]